MDRRGRLRHPVFRGYATTRRSDEAVGDRLSDGKHAIGEGHRRGRRAAAARCPTWRKVLYPETGFTKGEVIDYYTRIAPVLLPHLADRPLTVKRYPNGVDEQFFFEKNARARHAGLGAHRDAAGARLDDEPRHDRLRRRRGAGRRWCGWPTSPRSSCTCRSGDVPRAGPQAAHRPARLRPRPGPAGDDRRVLRGRAAAARAARPTTA